ncbi:MAG TPA: 3-dehydroquinate synthase [Verrucomicrobiae bacterium]|nr:3-dehydroquinate synthase [Verrucomicrobiae bacterium]
MKTIKVNAESGAYPVVCGRGALARLGGIVDGLRDGCAAYVLSSPRVWRHCGSAVSRNLRGYSRECVILFDDREAAKRLSTVEDICRKLVRLRSERNALLVAVGGGVVGDVAGFVAASYLRGVRIVHVPTTLVAQVDSAIGGKTGVNLPEGKNLVGAFLQPEAVIADPVLLSTLAPRQFRSGIYEVTKYGAIGDAQLFEFLERRLGDLLRLDMRALEFVIERSVRQKSHVVGKDERESGLRQILNFGHTIGHALESLTHYRCFLHGEAVAWGMLGAAHLAVATGRLHEESALRIARLIARCGGIPPLPAIPSAALLRAIAGDKKSRGGRVGWVLPRKIGAVDFGVKVADAAVSAAWRELPALYQRARKGV